MAASEHRPKWMVATDETILEDLVEERLDYVALVASRRGIHVPFARRRCRVLAEHGLLEQVTTEVTYRITHRGERYVAGDLDVRSLESDESTSTGV